MKTAVFACLLFASSASGGELDALPEVSSLRFEKGVVVCSPSRAQVMAVKKGGRGITLDTAVMILKLQFEAVHAYSLYLKRNETVIKSWLTHGKTVGPRQPLPESTRLEEIGAYLVSPDPRLRYVANEETIQRVLKFSTGVRLTVTVASWTGLDDKSPVKTSQNPPVVPLGTPDTSSDINRLTQVSPGGTPETLPAPDFSMRLMRK